MMIVSPSLSDSLLRTASSIVIVGSANFSFSFGAASALKTGWMAHAIQNQERATGA
jgi:hypothetical protein